MPQGQCILKELHNPGVPIINNEPSYISFVPRTEGSMRLCEMKKEDTEHGASRYEPSFKVTLDSYFIIHRFSRIKQILTDFF